MKMYSAVVGWRGPRVTVEARGDMVEVVITSIIGPPVTVLPRWVFGF